MKLPATPITLYSNCGSLSVHPNTWNFWSTCILTIYAYETTYS